MKTDTHYIDCTGDVVKGDEVCFQRATFTGSFRSAKFAGMETIEGKVIAEAYGDAKGQHTFTIQTADKKIRIKGRNLYRETVHRAKWENESDRDPVANENIAVVIMQDC